MHYFATLNSSYKGINYLTKFYTILGNTNLFTVVTALRQSFVFGQKATAPVLPLAPLGDNVTDGVRKVATTMLGNWESRSSN